jgi:hypothetical protein
MAKRTRATRRGGASRGGDAVSGTVTGRQETAWPGGGNLVRHPKGSNGGVHRGPDRQLRINAVRSILMEAMAKEGARLMVTAAGRRRRHRSTIPIALVTNLVTRIQEIAFTGSNGDVLRLVFGMHDVFQPGKHENGKNGHGGGPKPATFVTAADSPVAEAPAQPTAPGTLLDANGQEYVE